MPLEGRIVIEKAIECGIRLKSLLCVPADEKDWMAVSKSIAEKEGLLAPLAFTVETMSGPKMKELLGYAFHRGSIALAERPAEAIKMPMGPAIILWNITDPDNLGALIRSAAALGVAKVFLGPGCADPYSRKAIRASMACVLTMPVQYIKSIEHLTMIRQTTGIIIAAALVPDALSPAKIKKKYKTSKKRYNISLILGNEGWGLPENVIQVADACVLIPMNKAVDSLNVAAAGAILMWELFKKP